MRYSLGQYAKAENVKNWRKISLSSQLVCMVVVWWWWGVLCDLTAVCPCDCQSSLLTDRLTARAAELSSLCGAGSFPPRPHGSLHHRSKETPCARGLLLLQSLQTDVYDLKAERRKAARCCACRRRMMDGWMRMRFPAGAAQRRRRLRGRGELLWFHVVDWSWCPSLKVVSVFVHFDLVHGSSMNYKGLILTLPHYL